MWPGKGATMAEQRTKTLPNGADVKAVSEMLGHADVGITLKTYHHVNAKSIRQMHREFSPVVGLATAKQG